MRKLPLLFIILLISCIFSASRPAYAVLDAGWGAVFSPWAVTNKEQLNMLMMGSITGIAGPDFKRLVPQDDGSGEYTQMTGIDGTVNGLIPYFEKVYWPRMVMLFKGQAGANAKMSTGLQQWQNSFQEAGKQVDFMQTQRKMAVTNETNVLGRSNVICPHPSMGQSALAWQVLTQQEREKILDAYADELSGGSASPNTSAGKVKYDTALVQKRVELGVCTTTGSADADKTWCPSGNAATPNWDWNPEGLFGPKTLQETDKTQRTYMPFVKLYLDNMFPDRAFSPLGVASVKTISPEAAEVLTDRSAYGARLLTFMKPFTDAKAERTGFPNPAAGQSLKAALTRAGYPESKINEYIAKESGAMSQAAMDDVRYNIYYHDPQTAISTLGGDASLNLGNALTLLVLAAFDQTTLLYDTRQEIKKTNILLGALGSIMSKQEFDDIQSKTSALSAGQ